MSAKLENRLRRIKAKPKDYTYDEAKTFLISLGFEEFNKGRTSGSRIMFYRIVDKASIFIHKPHDGILKDYQITIILNKLKELGVIK